MSAPDTTRRSGPQRRAVLKVLRWVGEDKGDIVREWCLAGEMDEALALWIVPSETA